MHAATAAVFEVAIRGVPPGRLADAVEKACGDLPGTARRHDDLVTGFVRALSGMIANDAAYRRKYQTAARGAEKMARNEGRHPDGQHDNRGRLRGGLHGAGCRRLRHLRGVLLRAGLRERPWPRPAGWTRAGTSRSGRGAPPTPSRTSQMTYPWRSSRKAPPEAVCHHGLGDRLRGGSRPAEDVQERPRRSTTRGAASLPVMEGIIFPVRGRLPGRLRRGRLGRLRQAGRKGQVAPIPSGLSRICRPPGSAAPIS